MYTVSKLGDGRTFSAISVPPHAHESLSDDFKNLSRIHFYLGREPIDAMIKAIAQASPDELIRGRIQLYFAAKEIQDFLQGAKADLSVLGTDRLNKSLYFDMSFNHILEHTQEVLENAYNKPNQPRSSEIAKIMVGLTHEVMYLKECLAKQGLETVDINGGVEKVKIAYDKLYGLRTHYTTFADLPPFESFQSSAVESVKTQLQQPDRFDYSELTRIYMNDDQWMATRAYLDAENEKLDNGLATVDLKEAAELKDRCTRQFSAFNNLLHNGVVNYVNSYAAEISRQIFMYTQKTMVTPEAYYQREVSSLEHFKKIGLSNKKEHASELEELESRKDAFIKQKIEDKAFFEEHLTVLNRQLSNITQAFDSVRNTMLNIAQKNTITFEGDIKKGFVVGTCNNADKVLLVHKDPFVSTPEAIYAMVVTKDKYQELLASNKLEFTEELREGLFEKASNFWNYGQFLQEISDPYVQNHFLGGEFELVDRTSIPDAKPKIKKDIDYGEPDVAF